MNRNDQKILLKALKKWHLNVEKDKYLKGKLGYLLLSIYSKWDKVNSRTLLLADLLKWKAVTSKKEDEKNFKSKKSFAKI